ncbi:MULTISPECIES: acyl-CoA dehydrogenase family protein [unclassified Nocardioides]|uniref:acyl-CoA dehydrogenase family protein n=1 Tax=unclassified Nocardioides TaxID=2615069 RepID=UPI0011523DC8|nr:MULTISPECIES: acyl-CoA dehydrogenase family protein [unclassified Nocardioides]TQK72011.1 alkylation response protein AidB-like acyl-CoA dehydrogenase [Nocardioides sp. SLBN-35]WGY03800.1 acyl-CoA dehydrogenase family protein [Nocardioides sp. QY071]
MSEVLERIEARAEEIAALGPSNEKLGRLDDRAAELLRETGVIRMLQPAKYGGAEAHPADFAEAVMRLASLDGSTGWVAGIVGVHPWEMAMCDPRVQEEVWGEDHDTWIASPYAPMGVIRPVDGGYVFNGRWQFSSGTDHCDWIFLGAYLGDENGEAIMPPRVHHVILPRSDYTIVEDSWDVVGLRGTGSKDIIVKDAFIPDYRVVEFSRFTDGSQPREAGLTNPTYHIPFTTAFPLGITSAVIGIAEGALAAHLAYQRTRVQITGTKVKDDPYVLFAISQAAAEIQASRVSMLDNARRFHDKAVRGEEVSFAERAESRRTQVSAAWRAVRAMDEVVARSGGNGMRMDNPIQRFWRDGHMGLAHAIHVPGSVFHVQSLTAMDVTPPPGPMLSMI